MEIIGTEKVPRDNCEKAEEYREDQYEMWTIIYTLDDVTVRATIWFTNCKILGAKRKRNLVRS